MDWNPNRLMDFVAQLFGYGALFLGSFLVFYVVWLAGVKYGRMTATNEDVHTLADMAERQGDIAEIVRTHSRLALMQQCPVCRSQDDTE